MSIRVITCFVFFFLFSSCYNTNNDEVEIKMCADFLDKEEPNYYKGLNPEYILKADSFYAAQKNIPPYCWFLLYAHKTSYYYNKMEYDSSIKYNEYRLKTLTDNDLQKEYPNLYAEALNFKGHLLYITGRYDESYEWYFKAKKVAEQMKDTCSLTTYSYGLGMLSYKQKKYGASIGYFKQAIKYSGFCKEQIAWSIQEYIDNIALCYEKLHMPDSALLYYDSVLSYLEHNKSNIKYQKSREEAYAVVNGNKGTAMMMLGNTDSAINLFNSSYTINIQRFHDNKDALLVHLKLAHAYLVKGAMDMTKRCIEALKIEMDTIHHELDAESAWQELLYEYYEKKGDVNEAFAYYKQYAASRDSIWEGEKKQIEADALKAMAEKEQAYQMTILEKQNADNGRYLWAMVAFLGMTLLVIVLVYFNYRKEKKNIKVLTDLKNRLERNDKEKDKILNIVAHDLRGPVSGIYMVADMMLAEDNNSAEQIESIGLIKTASDTALDLINQLMVYKKEAREELKKVPTDISKLIDDDVKLLQLKANEKGINIRKQLGTSTIVSIDKEKINRVVNNLLGNAIKFSSAGSNIDVRIDKKETTVVVVIKDEGIGIPEQMQQHVFDMLTSAKREGTSGERSFGLGLSITKQIVEAHGGHIWLESKENEGTIFYVELPL